MLISFSCTFLCFADTTTAAEPDDDPDQKIWIICITVVGIICLVFALIVFIGK